jgi:hypothetical protein
MAARRPVYQGGSTGRRHGKGLAIAADSAGPAAASAACLEGRLRA